MALTGLKINKLLHGTNCGDCGSNTCLAFAIKLAAKKADLSDCPHASDEAKEVLGAASEPPVKELRLDEAGNVKTGGETCLYRHEKTFVNQTVLAVNIDDTLDDAAIDDIVRRVAGYVLERVGEELRIEMIAVTGSSGVPGRFRDVVSRVADASGRSLILRSPDSAMLEAGAAGAPPGSILAPGDMDSPDRLREIAVKHGLNLSLTAPDLDGLIARSAGMRDAGFDRILLELPALSPAEEFQLNSIARRAALNEGFKPLGFPFISFLEDGDMFDIQAAAVTEISKYGGVCVLPFFDPACFAPLMTLRQNIYTDPQKPIQVEPGLYEVGEPGEDSPVFVTTNFSLTYFIVSGELENAGISAWLLVPECEGMSVLTAWAAGKFSGATIGAFARELGIDDKLSARDIVIPGYVAQISGELEEELPGWHVIVGPPEAADLEQFLKQFLETA